MENQRGGKKKNKSIQLGWMSIGQSSIGETNQLLNEFKWGGGERDRVLSSSNELSREKISKVDISPRTRAIFSFFIRFEILDARIYMS